MIPTTPNLALEAFRRLPLISSHIGNTHDGLLKVEVRRDERMQMSWTALFSITAEGVKLERISQGNLMSKARGTRP